jgi:hypothetical protein
MLGLFGNKRAIKFKPRTMDHNLEPGDEALSVSERYIKAAALPMRTAFDPSLICAVIYPYIKNITGESKALKVTEALIQLPPYEI